VTFLYFFSLPVFLIFGNVILTAILYLKTRKRVHRDISYTNILLRELGPPELPVRTMNRKKFMDELELTEFLSEIEKLRKECLCREGLLIDYDYASHLADVEPSVPSVMEVDEESQGSNPGSGQNHSGDRTGTLPFIATELLKYNSIPHRVAHDLESLLYVLLFLCTHLDGPGNSIRDPPLYGPDRAKHPSSIKHWFDVEKLDTLAVAKLGHMTTFLEDDILSNISPYFAPLKPHITRMCTMLFRDKMKGKSGKDAMHSTATCLDFINIFRMVFQDQLLVDQAKKINQVLGKRGHDAGDLVSAENGWDAVQPSEELLKGDAKNNPTISRTSKFMAKKTKRKF